MQRNLRAAALLVSLAATGCWSSSKPSTTPSATDGSNGGPQVGSAPDARVTTVTATCAEAGNRLVVKICQRDGELEWTVTNRTGSSLWAFVAPPAGPVGSRDRANAIAMMTDGHLLLRKFQVQQIGGELVPVGAASLAPGANDSGRIPLGARLDTNAPNFSGAFAKGTSTIRSVELEIGYAEQRRGDQADAVAKSNGLVILPSFDRSRQQFVRSPVLSWR